jgi:hypothetical protein
VSPYLWTAIPFLVFFAIIVRFEIKHRKGDKVNKAEDEKYIQPIIAVTAKMHEQQYGKPSRELEKAFPELRAAK